MGIKTYEERLQKYAEELHQIAVAEYGEGALADRLANYDVERKLQVKLKRIIAREAAASLGARGGSKTSVDKVRTAQENGAKGGRPRKVKATK